MAKLILSSHYANNYHTVTNYYAVSFVLKWHDNNSNNVVQYKI